ncbi:hypothetical protein [Streptococcus thoraltensis]
MSKTIKEIAEELGYSKTYISKTIKKEGFQSSLRKIGNKFVIDEDIEMLLKGVLKVGLQTKNENKSESEFSYLEDRKLIKNAFKEALREESQTKNENNEVFVFLKEQLKEKDNQIAKKDDQIEKLNERLKETNIMLNESRKELADIKKLLIETEKETQKWWQFWKK